MERLAGGRRPEIKLVSRQTAVEAAIGVVRRFAENERDRAFRRVDGARSPHLAGTALHGDKAQELQYRVHADLTP